MASGEQQLQADYALVKKLLHDYPGIKLVATEGEPPGQYDIEYKLKGFKAGSDGTIQPANRHLVRIALPLGYPHVPPTVKPLSPIFHPDIAPDAIRIADFWKESRTLSDLIIHLGRMICGTFYSADPFNQRAFDWFEERKSWMPFDILESQGGAEEEASGPHEEQAPQGTAAAQPPVQAVQAPGPASREEVSPLDFTVAGEPVREEGEESTELDNLLEGEFSYAFDLDEQGAETAGGSEAMEDLTALPEIESFAEIEFESSDAAGPPEDLTVLQDETPSLDLALELETEQPTAEHQPDDLPLEGGEDFSTDFGLAKEPAAPLQETTIELGDIAGLGEDPGGSDAAPDLPLHEDFTAAFGIAGADQDPGEDHDAQEPVADEGVLEGISLQLEDDHREEYESDVHSIRPLIEGKEIFTAKKVMDDLSDPDSVPDREELERTIASAIREAEKLCKKAAKLEQEGEMEKAGMLLDLVANIATDYPGLDSTRNRIQESMLAGFQQKSAAEGEKKGEAVHAGVAPPVKPPPENRAVTKRGVKVPYIQLGALLALAGIAGGGTALYFKENASLEKARIEYNKGRQLAENMDFKEAGKAFTAARTELGSIFLFARGGKKGLSQAIDAFVSAPTFKEGLQGKVLHNGQYVTIETARAIDSFTLHTGAAERARQAGNFGQAIISYEKSLEYVEPAGFQDKIQDVRQTISALHLQQAMAMARKAEEENEWKKAADIYQKALELSSLLAEPEEHVDIARLQAAATLHHELEEGKRAFTASEWRKAVEILQRAQELITANPTLVTGSEQQEIGKLLINASVYQVLANAKNAFEQQEWEKAIKGYDNAIALLREKEDILGQNEVTGSISKIEKTLLMSKIALEQERIIRGSTDSRDLSTNLKHSRAIVSLIGKSPLKNDSGLREIYEDAKAQIANLEKDILINSKVEYLKDRYEKIFRENYPSAKSSELLNPQVTFIKREGNVVIFTMSCAEQNQGRTFRLELNYQYDLDKGTWSLYSGKL